MLMLLHGPLAEQLKAMKSRHTRFAQLDRPRHPLNPHTWRNLLDGMSMSVDEHQDPTPCWMSTEPHSFSQFMAFQMAKSCGAGHVGRLVRNCRLSQHISLSTLTMCHELPAHEQPQACSGK